MKRNLLILIFNLACDNSVQQLKIEEEEEEEERATHEMFNSESGKLRYHGYFYKNEVMDNEEELKTIRKFTNTIIFSTLKL